MRCQPTPPQPENEENEKNPEKKEVINLKSASTTPQAMTRGRTPDDGNADAPYLPALTNNHREKSGYHSLDDVTTTMFSACQ